MAMSDVLAQLEERIEELVTAYGAAQERITELQAKVDELENRAGDSETTQNRVVELEKQREDLAGRLEKVLSNIDEALKNNEN